jgi:L-alanine-DL-glutamate epimerase-like enolase superfamily enzyme
MTIRSIEAIPLCLPYDMFGPKPLLAGLPRQMDILLVRVETDSGVVGWGEAFGFAVWPATRAAIDNLVAPLAVGQDEADIAGLANQLQRKLHLLGRTGPVTYALSGLDIALWDIAGKVANKPVSELLGGAKHKDLPAYASLMRYADSGLIARNSAAACDRGYKAIKLHEITAEHVRVARQAIGPDIALMMDCNCPWTVQQALDMARSVKPYDLLWFEEPVWPPEDFAGLAEVRRQAGIAISAGENTMNATNFEQMFIAGAVDIAQPSVTKTGGITEILKILPMAEKHGVEVVPHSPYFGPGLLASLHLVSTFAKETMVEYSYSDLGANPLGESIEVHDGRILVPTGPGLGRDPDPEIVSRYRVA